MQRDDIPLPIVFMDDEAAELEFLIAEYGQNMLDAYAEGNRKAAEQWLELQRLAIRSRSVATVQAMETQMGLGPCQFIAMANEARSVTGACR